jgi:hypothetical protein
VVNPVTRSVAAEVIGPPDSDDEDAGPDDAELADNAEVMGGTGDAGEDGAPDPPADVLADVLADAAAVPASVADEAVGELVEGTEPPGPALSSGGGVAALLHAVSAATPNNAHTSTLRPGISQCA